MRLKQLFHLFFALALALSGRGALAQSSASSPATKAGSTICTNNVQRGGGYRDLAVRFETSRSPIVEGPADRYETSYRDSARRRVSAPLGYANAARTLPRYSLLTSPSCG